MNIGRPKIFLVVTNGATIRESSTYIGLLEIGFIGINPVKPINADHPQLETVMIIWDEVMGVNTDLVVNVVQVNIEVSGVGSIAHP